MSEFWSEDITVRAHLFPGGEAARGAIFIGRLGVYRFECSRQPGLPWSVTFSGEEIPYGLHEHLIAAALSAIGVAEGMYRQPPPRILSVGLEDLRDETAEPSVDLRDILTDAGIAQGFVSLPGKGRFTFQADRRGDGEWSVTFGLDYTLPEDVALRLERIVRARIEEEF